MPITPNQRAGIAINTSSGLLPDTPVVFENTFSQGYSLPKTTVNTSVEDAIKDKLKLKDYIRRYQFPLVDFPKYNFTLIENDVNVGGFTTAKIGTLTPQKVYKFPLPEPLVDVFSVQYKQDFSYLNAAFSAALAAAIRAGPSLAVVGVKTAAVAAAVAGVAAIGVGPGLISGSLALNRFNTVTLDSASFREFELNWKLVPRNYNESKTLQSIITSLKRGSAPRFAEDPVFGATVPGLFRYPKVYTMFFQPNSQFLFKFKPAVLRGITIHYDGGAGAPSFYKPPPLTPAAPGSPLAAQQNENNKKVIQNSPPESIIINTAWMEIELWSENSYKDDPNTGDPNLEGMPSPNPLDAINDIRYFPERTNPLDRQQQNRYPFTAQGVEQYIIDRQGER